MTTRLLLIKPDVGYPVKKQGHWGDVGIPLNLLYLGAFVRQNNAIEIGIKDYRLEHTLGNTRNLESDLSHADIVGVGACTSESPDALHILKQAKKQGKITVMGGLYPTFNSNEVLNTGFVDFVVRGEGELGLSGLLSALQGKISLGDVDGISYKRDGIIVDNPSQGLIENLDALPMPAYDLINAKDYSKFTSATIYSSRGCPMTCKFCTLNEMWGFRHRKRSYESIIKELRLLKELGFTRVNFKDETVTLDRDWAVGLFKEIEKANLGLTYKAKSRINQVDPELIQQMVRAGLDTIHTGIETISHGSLKGMGKRINAESIRSYFDVVLENGCKINPVYLFSWVGETKEDLEKNAGFIKEMGKREGVITYISFITPHPGSAIDQEPGLEILTKDYSRYTHKQPVAVPKSLGKNGLKLMIDYYHSITEAIGMQEFNPRIDPEYLEEILNNKMVFTLKGGLIAA